LLKPKLKAFSEKGLFRKDWRTLKVHKNGVALVLLVQNCDDAATTVYFAFRAKSRVKAPRHWLAELVDQPG
jgi:hypothetical protein